MSSLWGDEFIIEPKINSKKIIDKANNPKKVDTVKKVSTKKSMSIIERLSIISQEVLRVLGVYKDSTIVIRDRETLHNYIDVAISNGIIAIDTETNNSLDPITCLLMGGCIYTPGMKNAYIPINHTDLDGNILYNQCSEKDIYEEFSRLSDTKIIMHNGKFDYQVIKCTCNLPLKIYWDTMIAAKILDENEKSAGLKQQYIQKIDSSIEKYSIDELFKNIEYKYVDPEIFALYSATDAYMTYKLYEWQKERFDLPENKKMLSLLLNIEMPIVEVSAEMELTGVCLDIDYAKRLSEKYNKQLVDIDKKISVEYEKYRGLINDWKLTDDAIKKPIKGKSKLEQLEDPINMSSPTQLAIFLYDILKVKPVERQPVRGTGEDVLKALDIPLCNLILEKRGLLKLINTYIDKLPACVNPKTGRLHAHFNQYGAATGRFSSSDPNLQNIPSHTKDIRLMFTASDYNGVSTINDNIYEFSLFGEVEIDKDTWKLTSELSIGDTLFYNDDSISGYDTIKYIEYTDDKIIVTV